MKPSAALRRGRGTGTASQTNPQVKSVDRAGVADRKVDYLIVQDNDQVRAWLNDLGGRGWIWQDQIIGDVGVDRWNVRLADVNGDRKTDHLGIGPVGQIGAWDDSRYPGNPPAPAPIPPDGWPPLCVANHCP